MFNKNSRILFVSNLYLFWSLDFNKSLILEQYKKLVPCPKWNKNWKIDWIIYTLDQWSMINDHKRLIYCLYWLITAVLINQFYYWLINCIIVWSIAVLYDHLYYWSFSMIYWLYWLGNWSTAWSRSYSSLQPEDNQHYDDLLPVPDSLHGS